MGNELDIEDEKFNSLLQDKRHKELTKSLGAIATGLSKRDDKAIVDAIAGQSDKIGELVSSIKSIPAPEVNVEVDMEKFVSSMHQICENIVASNNKVIEAIENRMLPDSFQLIKPYGDVTESVKVNYKPANKIAVKK